MLTRASAFGAHAGRRYGSFAGKGAGSHPVAQLTQPAASGAHAGRQYGSFAGRGVADQRRTQAVTFGAHAGRRYGSFAGRLQSEEQAFQPGGIRVRLAPRGLLNPDEEDELLLALCAAACAAFGRLH